MSRITFQPICFLLLLQNWRKVYHFLKKPILDKCFKIECHTSLGVINIDGSHGWKDFMSVYMNVCMCVHVSICVNMRTQKLFCTSKVPVLYNQWTLKSIFITIRVGYKDLSKSLCMVGLVILMLISKISYLELMSKQNFLHLKFLSAWFRYPVLLNIYFFVFYVL